MVTGTWIRSLLRAKPGVKVSPATDIVEILMTCRLLIDFISFPLPLGSRMYFMHFSLGAERFHVEPAV